MKTVTTAPRLVLAAAALVLAMAAVRAQNAEPQGDAGVRFKSGVELVNVTATVSDSMGRFVPGLERDDFLVYEDNNPVDIMEFSAERVPVSLGIVLDTSGSMAGHKMEAARAALTRFTEELLDRADELFLYRFSNYPGLAQGWTNDRQRILYALDRMTPYGGTAMYDAVEDAIPLAQQGRNRKRALVVISDGNDTASHVDIRDLKQQIRESEVLVYAIGIDGEGEPTIRRAPTQPPPRIPMPIPFPFPGMPRGRSGWPQPPPIGGSGGSGGSPRYGRLDDRVNAAALRELTDDSGGRTEIVRDPRDLDPATAGIADELSKQYYLAYTSPGKKDGRWHSIRVEVKNRAYRVRSRRGYVAS
jgi:VWFA-related protein